MDCQPARLRFSLVEVPPQQRVETLRDVFGAGYANISFVPLTDDPQLEVETVVLPGVAITRGFYTPHFLTFNQDVSKASDDFTFVAGCGAKRGRMTHRGGEIISGDGSGFLISCAEPSSAETQSLFFPCAVTIERSMLLALLPDAEDALMRLVPAENPALQLLNAYLRTLSENQAVQTPDLAYAVATHIRDLVVLALGADRDAQHLAAGGLRAARMAAIERWILERLANPDLCVAKAAVAQGVGPRYVQLLFEAEGTTFSSYVLSKRLSLARRLLSDPALGGRTIGAIAYDAGFNDLSYFNRVFRAAFQRTPSDVRQGVTNSDAFGSHATS